MGVETENYEIAAKRFENTFRAIVFGFRGRRTPEGLKGPYKSESSLMTRAARLGNPDGLFYHVLSDMGKSN